VSGDRDGPVFCRCLLTRPRGSASSSGMILHRRAADSLGLNERQIAAVNYLKRRGSISNQEYQKLNNAKKATATRDLKAMVQSGILRKEGTTGPGVRYLQMYAERDSKRT